MKILLLSTAALLALATHADAARFSAVNGSRLSAMCTSRDAKMSNSCTAYIEGVSDSMSLYQELRPQDGSRGGALPGYVCVPEQVTGLQQRDTVVAWIRQHPEAGTRQASGVVADALREAFACR